MADPLSDDLAYWGELLETETEVQEIGELLRGSASDRAAALLARVAELEAAAKAVVLSWDAVEWHDQVDATGLEDVHDAIAVLDNKALRKTNSAS